MQLLIYVNKIKKCAHNAYLFLGNKDNLFLVK